MVFFIPARCLNVICQLLLKKRDKIKIPYPCSTRTGDQLEMMKDEDLTQDYVKEGVDSAMVPQNCQDHTHSPYLILIINLFYKLENSFNTKITYMLAFVRYFFSN